MLCPESWYGDMSLHQLFFDWELLMKSHCKRLFLLSPKLFSICTGICIKELIGSAVLFPIPPLSKLPSFYSLLCVFLLVHLHCVVFLEQVQLVTNWHQGEIFTIQQRSNKKHTLQMQQLKQSKLTHGLESPKWTGCQTTVSTYNYLGIEVELLVFCW